MTSTTLMLTSMDKASPEKVSGFNSGDELVIDACGLTGDVPPRRVRPIWRDVKVLPAEKDGEWQVSILLQGKPPFVFLVEGMMPREKNFVFTPPGEGELAGS